MKAPARCAALMACLALGSAWAQAPAAQLEPAKTETAGEKKVENASPLWAWANFVILVGFLGYLSAKHGGPWFVSRSIAIRRGIAEAEEIRSKAEAHSAEVDRKLAGLKSEIEFLRSAAHREQAAEAERIRKQTAADLDRLQEHATGEIAAAGKAARLELKRYSAQLAIDLAEQKIRRQMTPEMQNGLVESFTRDLNRPPSGQSLSK